MSEHYLYLEDRIRESNENKKQIEKKFSSSSDFSLKRYLKKKFGRVSNVKSKKTIFIGSPNQTEKPKERKWHTSYMRKFNNLEDISSRPDLPQSFFKMCLNFDRRRSCNKAGSPIATKLIRHEYIPRISSENSILVVILLILSIVLLNVLLSFMQELRKTIAIIMRWGFFIELVKPNTRQNPPFLDMYSIFSPSNIIKWVLVKLI
ncbi:hypothetical protein NCAS_0G03230 [Naumovozyma castellii]|uniref:Uncharacterized protein n=1 Tax=Naumovozyma castellii TaxID=27288 RepID=G0VIH5_NAUCA|nr:hypothetical protein NCAS_0G03230 [Naumovozyma castellii CBS 4309]CCC71210.1 hypothetical protein NCAS_0G03230 [Naumovozyma castellii CBS 4309]